MTDLADYIIHLKRRVPAGLCDRIVKTAESSNLWKVATVGQGEVSPNRQCHAVNLGEWRALDAEFFTFVTQVLSHYRSKFPYADVNHDTGYNVLRYRETDHFKEHVDAYETSPRVVSCSVDLNEDYEGGEFAFFGSSVTYSLGKGDVLLFPSNFLYPHQILPVTAGTRYSIVTWFQ